MHICVCTPPADLVTPELAAAKPCYFSVVLGRMAIPKGPPTSLGCDMLSCAQGPCGRSLPGSGMMTGFLCFGGDQVGRRRHNEEASDNADSQR